MKNKLLIILVGLLFFAISVQAQKDTQNGVTFKTPDGYMMRGLSPTFKGVLMLNAERPSGIIVTYPNDDESIEKLKERLREYVLPMFAKAEKGDETIKNAAWQTKNIPNHKGDKGDYASMSVYENDKQIVQVALYEREWNGLTIVYGYFAMKNKDDNKNKDLLDDSGKGVKAFDKFWKTFPKK